MEHKSKMLGLSIVHGWDHSKMLKDMSTGFYSHLPVAKLTVVATVRLKCFAYPETRSAVKEVCS